MRVGGGLGAIAEARLGEDICDVVRDSVEANEQLICDLLVRLAFGDQLEDFDLPVGESVRVVRARRSRGVMRVLILRPSRVGSLGQPSRAAVPVPATGYGDRSQVRRIEHPG